MAKQIKHISELPSWFNLDKYDLAKELDATGWHEQLIIRRAYLTRPYLLSQPEILAITREYPILDIDYNEITRGIFGVQALIELKDEDLRFSFGVRHLTPMDMMRAEFNIPLEKQEYLNECRDEIQDFLEVGGDLDELDCGVETWTYQPIRDLLDPKYEDMCFAYIKLELPDALLIEHFKQFLATHRAQTSSKKRTRLPDFKEWCRLGVLPYLDLKIWEQEQKVSIPNRVMADAIYQPGEGGEENVRKTTAPLAEYLITERSFEILSAIAANEITEEKAKQNFPESISS